jgi:site-specific recombinase XerD
MSGRLAYPPKDLREMRKILQLVDQKNPIIALMLEFSCLSGLRFCDVSKLTFKELYINGVIRSSVIIIQSKIYAKSITAGKSEAEAKRVAKLTVYLTDQCKAVIEDAEHLNHGKALIFESSVRPGKPYTCQHVNQILKTVAAELRLDYQLSTHSMRKAFAKALVDNGASIHQVRDGLGQASLSSTDHYLSTFMSDSERLVQAIKF